MMSEPLSYAIIGTGAIGGYYGGCLNRIGLPVHFLLHNDYEIVKEKGLKIKSVTQGEFILNPIFAYNDVKQMPACDVIIVALKTTHNHLLKTLLPPLLKENSLVILLQNGIAIEEEIAQIIGYQRVVGGLCFVCCNKIAPGYIHHLDYGEVTLGHYAPHYQITVISEQLQAIQKDFSNAGITVNLTEDLLWVRWKKLIWNIPYNSLSVILNATTKEMMNHPDIYALIKNIMKEVQLIAKSCNRVLPDEVISHNLDYTQKMTPYKTSMKLDFENHRPLEVEAIVGNSLKIAQEKGVNTPYITMLYQQLKYFDAVNCSHD